MADMLAHKWFCMSFAISYSIDVPRYLPLNKNNERKRSLKSDKKTTDNKYFFNSYYAKT